MVQLAGVGLLLFGMLGKFGALFVTIPDPVMGGLFLIMFGTPQLYIGYMYLCVACISAEYLCHCCTVLLGFKLLEIIWHRFFPEVP